MRQQKPGIRWVGGLLAPIAMIAACQVSPETHYNCADCTFDVAQVGTLGRDAQQGLWGYPRAVTQAPTGRYFVQVDLEGPAPFVFSADGNPMGRFPSEPDGGSLVSTGGGAPALFGTHPDGNGWIHRLDARSGQETIALHADHGHFLSGVERADGSLVLSRHPRQGEFSLLSLEDETYREFGPVVSKTAPIELGLTSEQQDRYRDIDLDWLRETATARVLASADDDGVWAAATLYEYRIELWDHEGTLRRILEPEAAWFPASSPGSSWGHPGQASPAIHGLWEDESGLLWVVGQTPDPTWDPTTKSPAELLDSTEKLYAKMYDVVIEAIDPVTGEIVHHGRLPTATGYPQVISPGVVGIPRQTALGNWEVDLMRVSGRTD